MVTADCQSFTRPFNLPCLLFLQVSLHYWRLTVHIALSLSMAKLNKCSTLVTPVHSLTLRNHDCLRLPASLLPSTFLIIINWSSRSRSSSIRVLYKKNLSRKVLLPYLLYRRAVMWHVTYQFYVIFILFAFSLQTLRVEFFVTKHCIYHARIPTSI